MEQLFAFSKSGEGDKHKEMQPENRKQGKKRKLVCRRRGKVWKNHLLCGVQIKFYRLLKSESSAGKRSLGCLGFLF